MGLSQLTIGLIASVGRLDYGRGVHGPDVCPCTFLTWGRLLSAGTFQC